MTKTSVWTFTGQYPWLTASVPSSCFWALHLTAAGLGLESALCVALITLQAERNDEVSLGTASLPRVNSWGNTEPCSPSAQRLLAQLPPPYSPLWLRVLLWPKFKVSASLFKVFSDLITAEFKTQTSCLLKTWDGGRGWWFCSFCIAVLLFLE